MVSVVPDKVDEKVAAPKTVIELAETPVKRDVPVTSNDADVIEVATTEADVIVPGVRRSGVVIETADNVPETFRDVAVNEEMKEVPVELN
jgi:hypothetical protein